MRYNLSNTIDKEKFKYNSNKLYSRGSMVELKEIKSTRSTRQNSSLHLYYEFISDELNELGLEYILPELNISLTYTPNLVKEVFWRPIQIAMFNIESTTKINTKQINEIVEVISKFFAEKGIVINFPSIETLIE